MSRSHSLVAPLLAAALLAPVPALPGESDRASAVLSIRLELQQQLGAWLTASLAAPAEPYRVVATAQLQVRGDVRETVHNEEQPGSELKVGSGKSMTLPGLGVVNGATDSPGSPNIMLKIPGRKTAQVTRTLETAVERMSIRLFVEPKMPADRRELLKKIASDLAAVDVSRGDVVEVQELTAPAPPTALANRDIPWSAIIFSATVLLSAIIIAIGLSRRPAPGGGFGARGAKDEFLLGEPIEEGTSKAGLAPASGPGALRAFPGLAGATPEELLELLGEVEPVVAAVVLDLVGLDAATTRRLFERLPHDRQLEIGMTLGTGRTLLRPTLDAMETAVEAALAKVRNRVQVGGPGRLADLLAQAPAASQQGILDAISMRNTALAEAVRARMVFFGDLAGLADASVRQVVTSVNPATVALAMVGASDQLRQVVLGAVSKRLRAILEAELEVVQERPAAEIEAARKTVEAAMHRLQQKSELLARAA